MGGRGLLRRILAAALAVIALWALSLTVSLPDIPGLLRRLGSDPEFVVGALSARLDLPREGTLSRLDGWGRLLIRQSALLSSFRERQGENPPDTPEPIDALPEEEDNPQTPQLTPVDHGEVVEHTALGKDDGSYLSAREVYLKNTTRLPVDVAALAAQPVDLQLGEGPQILIYHTHGSEAYTQEEGDAYVESDPYRTTDCTKNVVCVGEEMAQVFRSMGFEVVHDTTLYDYPVYNTAYDRARAGVARWLEQYPTIRFVLDVHRDALISADGAAYKLIAQEDGARVAQVMLVAGSNDAGAEHPNWRQNLALAVQLQLRLTEQYDQLARPITLRSSRFNQHLSSGALLVEVGSHGNTLQEAIAGGRLFAQAAGEVLKTQMAS